jgi:hypothetical protein
MDGEEMNEFVMKNRTVHLHSGRQTLQKTDSESDFTAHDARASAVTTPEFDPFDPDPAPL